MGVFRTVMIIGFLLLLGSPVFAAQSTKDVTASDALKKEAMGMVLGNDSPMPHEQGQYVVGHGDILEVQVYGEGSMAVSAPGGGRTDDGGEGEGLRGSGSGVQVRIDGRISLKHLGDVQAVGMNLTELADYLKILYETVYEEPIVTVVLKQSNSQRYTVMGKVSSPGIFYLDYPINLVQVVARCGGFNEWANSELTVVRKNGEKPENLFDGNTLSFDYDDFLKGKSLEKNVLIQAGDIIIAH
ncbi:polysaccharide biosynthesis/export family protein [Desulfopila sp. IMCC35008]|uniref:polysaccharide biosynthesis/export family protein n=1 Tax=Desulfopila sp. IMCC35008 TaxID=2653858 RepID=UPI0013D38BDC|nr:polysaccharide biosynthesis/export family protein [Desulfopila sp. IMCC35008]